METVKALLAALSLALVLTGCSDVKFEAVPNHTCQAFVDQFGSNGCVVTPDGYNSFNYSVKTGKVDILVVDDNSGSMYVEQAEMANRFPGFLDSISQLDYRIAITTTDIIATAGQFLSYPNGSKYIYNTSRTIDSRHYDNINQFQATIKRPETLTCDSSGFVTCPSGDERGIYAANLALARNEQSFFRANSHLALIILSDEDERSNGGNITGYPLEDLDQPLTFVQRSKTYLPGTTSVSVHPIIIKPGDSGCWSVQNNQTSVRGYYGNNYAALASPTAEMQAYGNILSGSLGSICSTNYTAELGNIASYLNQSTSQIQLPCAPYNGIVNITYSPAPSDAITYSVSATNLLTLSPTASAGTTVNVSYKCKI